MTQPAEKQRTLGFLGATSVGVGAIVGGGILALTGVAFSEAGPAAIAAFGLNGVIALLTALSFAEMASKFPESGGTYAFAKKVLSVEAAFIVGWVVWFASIVAAVLYAVGFAYFALILVGDLVGAGGGALPEWTAHDWVVPVIAVFTTIGLGAVLIHRSAGGGNWVNIAKIFVFAILVIAGLWAVSNQSLSETRTALTPFFSHGTIGLIHAMGYTFIALQGFDLIAAVGGEVRQPERNLPRAIVMSLLIALAIYLPLLFVIATVGTPGLPIGDAAESDPEGIVAIAAENYLGPFGYWLVIVAAVLSMFSALQANLFAASRIAFAMARDRTLPAILGRRRGAHQTPVAAIVITTGLVAVILIILPDVADAGAAASLIFLVTFALAHWIAILVRQRSFRRPPPFRAPLFPLIPIVGGIACLGLAVFQGIAVPAAGSIAIIWIALGAVLFLGLFAGRARIRDISSAARNPELITLRGRTPFVLVPIANPQNAEAMIKLADALVPADIGRVLMQNVVVVPEDWNPDDDPAPIDRSQEVIRELLKTSAKLGVRAEALTTIAQESIPEIVRVARLHRCRSILVGLSKIPEDAEESPLERLLDSINADVFVLRAPNDWDLAKAERILIPVGGRGGHGHLQARLVGSLARESNRRITYLQVVPGDTSTEEIRRLKRSLKSFAEDQFRFKANIEVVTSDDPVSTVAEYAHDFDLVVLGAQRIGQREKVFGSFTRALAICTSCPLIVLSGRGS